MSVITLGLAASAPATAKSGTQPQVTEILVRARIWGILIVPIKHARAIDDWTGVLMIEWTAL